MTNSVFKMKLSKKFEIFFKYFLLIEYIIMKRKFNTGYRFD